MIYLYYWKHSRYKRKKFNSVDAARKYGRKLLKKDKYAVNRYGCIHIHLIDSAGDTTLIQEDL